MGSAVVRVADTLVEARFVERPNRFVVVGEVEGKTVRAHCPNPGRLEEFQREGTPLLLAPARAPDRVTDWDLVAGRHRGGWVTLDTRLANDVFAEAVADGRLDDLLGPVVDLEAEPTVGAGRLDFRVRSRAGDALVEVKSVTLLDPDDGRTGLFPDAPTERGTRHVRELAERSREAVRTVLAFVAMRADVTRIRPHRERDPDFASALADAAAADVHVVGLGTRLDGTTLTVGDRIPVAWDPEP